jgi:hypothetical protein
MRVTSYDRKVTHGTVIPDFKRRKKAGELLPHTAFRQTEIHGAGYGKYDVGDANGNRTWVTPDYWVSGFWYLTEVELYELAFPYHSETAPLLQSAAARIMGSGFDVGTFLGELRETLAMFPALLSRFIRFLKRKPVNMDWHQYWLEFNFGWRPIYEDIKTFVEAVNSATQKRGRYSERVGRSESYVDVEVSTYNDGVVSFTKTIETTINVSMRGSLTADVEPAKFRLSPVTTAWELITLSWMVDYFFSVGWALDALQLKLLASGNSASSGVRLSAVRQMQTSAPIFAGGRTGTVFQEALCEGYIEWRVPTRLSLKPQIRGEILSFDQLRNLLAVLRGVFR